MLKPCIECGTPSTESRCDDHTPQTWRHHNGSARERGYDRAWDKLSARARRLQPFCSDCHTTENLTTDHKPSAWKRKAEGKPLRLWDVDVVCAPCNLARGSSRPGSERAQGTRTVRASSGPGGKAQSQSLSALPLDGGSDETQDVERSFPSDALVVEHHQLTDQQHVGKGHDHVVVREAVAEGGSEELLVEYARPRFTTEEGRHQLDSLHESSIEFRVHDWTLS